MSDGEEIPVTESEQPEPPPPAPDLIGRIEITVSKAGAMHVGGEFPDAVWLGDTLGRALRFIDRELLAARLVQGLNQGVQIAQQVPKARPASTPRWPIR